MKQLIELFCAFFRIGIFTFGGGYAMLPMLEREIVDKHKWATMEEVMDYFAVGQCTPGIIAVNTATFVGYKQKGVAGGIFATLGVVTPSIIIISLIASILSAIYKNPLVGHAFSGIAVAVSAILVQSVLKLFKSGVSDKTTFLVAAISFVLAKFFGVTTIVIVIVAGAFGVVYRFVLRNKGKGDM